MSFERTIRKSAPGMILVILLLVGLRLWTWMTIPWGNFKMVGFESSEGYWRFDFPHEVYLVTAGGRQGQGNISKEHGEWFLNLNNLQTPSKWRLETSLMELRAFKMEPLPTTNFVLKRILFTPTLPKPAQP